MTEARALLRELLRVDTSNPPGNETTAALLLREFLETAGVECRLPAREPERANLVARLRGGDGPTLAFLGHLDVVPGEHEGWSVRPFAGLEQDGWIFGRGAVDMKGALAAWAAALAGLARDGVRPPGDVLLVAAADEEVGDAGVGMPWLVERHPDLVRADYFVGEGAGERLEADGGPVYLYSVGEKPSSTATVVVRGRAGDPGLPANGDNPLPRFAELLSRLADYRPQPRPHEVLGPFLELHGRGEALEILHDAVTRTTLVPTLVQDGRVDNVVPPAAHFQVRCGVQPGTTKEELEAELRAALGDGGYELDVVEPLGGTVSPADTPLASAIRAFVAGEEPEARVLPTLGAGYTDLHVVREELGAVAYGFIPFRHVDPLVNLSTKHGADERIRVEDLDVQQRCARALATAEL